MGKLKLIERILKPNRSVLQPMYSISSEISHPVIQRVVSSNGKIRLRLGSHTDLKPREFVIEPSPIGKHLYYIHMRTWDGKQIPATLTLAEKQALFEATYNELPYGSEILLPRSSPKDPATRGTLAGLLRLSRDSRFKKGHSGILYYRDRNKEIKTFNGTGFIKIQPKIATRLELQYPGQRIIFGYFGRKHSINEVVNPDGTVNLRKAMLIADEAARTHGGLRLTERLEDPLYHTTDPNTFLHLKEVALRAWQMPVPKGYTKQDQMFAAIGHDFGKIFAGEGHGLYGADYLRQVFPDMTEALYRAIRDHMFPFDQIHDPLTLATKGADWKEMPIKYEY